MRIRFLRMLGVSVCCLSLVMLTSVAQAFPSRGAQCRYCHAQPVEDKVDIKNTDGTSLSTVSGPKGTLGFFDVAPGGTVDFRFTVNSSGAGSPIDEDGYYLILDRLDTIGNGTGIYEPYSPKLYTADASWSQGRASGGEFQRYLGYYGQTYAKRNVTSKVVPSDYDFGLALDPNAIEGLYLLTATISGGDPDSLDSPGWYQSQNFYVRVVPEPASLVMLLSGAAIGGAFWIRRRKLSK